MPIYTKKSCKNGLILTLFSLFIILSPKMLNAQEFSFQNEVLLTTNADTTEDFFGDIIDMEENIAVVGSPSYKNGQGCIYVLEYDGVKWQNIAKLTYSAGQENDNFGVSVRISEDVIVAGAIGDFLTGRAIPGYVCIFKKPLTGWTTMNETATLSPSDGDKYMIFGGAVDIKKDLIVVGARGADVNDISDGAVYIYEKPNSGWANAMETKIIFNEDGQYLGGFGTNVLITDHEILVVEFNQIFVFNKPMSNWENITELARLSLSENYNHAFHFGHSLEHTDSLIIVGAHGGSRGYVFLYEKQTNGWKDTTQTHTLTSSNIYYYNEEFGSSISATEDFIIVGAMPPFEYEHKDGSVYVFRKPASGWKSTTESYKLATPLLEPQTRFGSSMAFSGDNLLIGAKIRDRKNITQIYHYKKNATKVLDLHNERFHIYPNPTSSIIHINVEEFSKIKLTLYDISGNVILMKQLTRKSSTLDITELEKGIYMLKLELNNKIYAKRIVKI